MTATIQNSPTTNASGGEKPTETEVKQNTDEKKNKSFEQFVDAKDAEEYIKYIQYLQAQGTLNNDLEEIELDELQGVKGLKALRVGVKLEETETSRQMPDTDSIVSSGILNKTPLINPN